MRPVVTSFTFTVDPDGIIESVTPGAGGAITLDGALVADGVATLDAAQKVSITSVASEVARTFTITGTDLYGRSQTEDVTGGGAGATVKTAGYYKTVTAVSVDDATTGAITVGSGNEGVDITIPTDWRENDFRLSLAVVLSAGATLTYTVEYTLDNIQDATVTPTWFATTDLDGLTASASSNIAFPVRAVRLNITSFTDGTATLTALQAGGR